MVTAILKVCTLPAFSLQSDVFARLFYRLLHLNIFRFDEKHHCVFQAVDWSRWSDYYLMPRRVWIVLHRFHRANWNTLWVDAVQSRGYHRFIRLHVRAGRYVLHLTPA